MNNQEGLEFIRNYFDELFRKRNLDALDTYLDKDYFDEDIGDGAVDHIRNSKAYLTKLFKTRPSVGVDVKDAITQDNVISAFLEWFVVENNAKRVIMKGVAIFEVHGVRIQKRHTYLYYRE
jgi:SnoaL-like domain